MLAAKRREVMVRTGPPKSPSARVDAGQLGAPPGVDRGQLRKRVEGSRTRITAMISDILLQGRVRLVAAGLLLAVLGGTGSCGDSVGVDGHDDPGPGLDRFRPADAERADGAVRTGRVGGPFGDLRLPASRHHPNGVAATISNRRTSAGLTVPLLDGGLDPVPIAAEAGDTLAFAVDVGASAPERFIRVVPNRAAKRTAHVACRMASSGGGNSASAPSGKTLVGVAPP